MWKYIGPGWLPGVPARDLTDDEMTHYKVEASCLYERVTEPQKPAGGDKKS